MNEYQLICDKLNSLISKHQLSVIISVQQSREEFLDNYPSLGNTDILILDHDELLR